MSSVVITPRSSAVAPSARSALHALVLRGLLDARRAPLVWGAPLGAMSALVVALYPSIRTSLANVVDDYPAGVKAAFGVTDLGSLESYLHVEMFSLMLPLAVAYFAMRCVAASIAGAEEHGWLDTILSTPVARRSLVAGAMTTTAILVASVLLVAGTLTAAAAALVGESLALDRLAAALAGVWALALFFGACAALASGLLHRSGPVLGTGGGLLGAMYLLDVLGKLADGAAALRYASAFRYLGSPLLDGFDFGGFAVLLGAALALTAAGAVFLDRRDLTG